MGKVGTCSVRRKEKTIVSQRNRVKIDVGVVRMLRLRKNRQLKCFVILMGFERLVVVGARSGEYDCI